MPRSIWSGAITFGMISIPVRLATGTRSKDVAFHQMHAPDHSRIGYLKVCKAEEKEVPAEEIVRAYEVRRDHYVEVTDDDLDKLPLPTKHTISLDQFVHADEVDPAFYDRTYLLEPQAAGTKPYALLMRAMRQKGVFGLAKIALRNKEQLCVLRPHGDALVLQTLHWADEVLLDELPQVPEAHANPREIQMATDLIEALVAPFEPGKYQDDYREALLALIEEKEQGREVVLAPAAAEAPAGTQDLMAALRASLAAHTKTSHVGEDRGKRRPAARGKAEEEPEQDKAPAGGRAKSRRSRAA